MHIIELYPFLVFLHVIGAVGMFTAWGIEAAALSQLHQAITLDQIRASLSLRRRAVPVGAVSMPMAVATGVWMMRIRWGFEPWMLAAFAGLALIVVAGVALERRAMPPLAAAVTAGAERLEGTVLVASRRLWTSLRLRLAIGVAILALMTMKPGPLGSVAVVGAAIVVGLATAIAPRRRWHPDAVRS